MGKIVTGYGTWYFTDKTAYVISGLSNNTKIKNLGYTWNVIEMTMYDRKSRTEVGETTLTIEELKFRLDTEIFKIHA